MNLLLSLLVVLSGAEASQSVNERAQAERLATIQKDYADATAAYRKAVQTLPDDAGRNQKARELTKAYSKVADECLASAVEVASVDPRSNSGFAALEWIL